MGKEQFRESEHEGEHYLDLIGLAGWADREIPTKSKGTIAARDFLEVCGQDARPAFKEFESMTPDNPKYQATRNALRSMVGLFVGDNPDQ